MDSSLKQPIRFIDINSQVTTSAVQAATNLCNEAKVTRSNKTPISLLQEIAAKCSCQPLYENISTDTHLHDTKFIYRVVVGDITAVATGNSKKAAKHSAALSILNEIKAKSVGKNDVLAQKIEYLLKSISEANLDEVNGAEESHAEANGGGVAHAAGNGNGNGGASDDSRSEHRNENEINPVGTLLEITQKFALRPPVFEFSEEEGQSANNKTYTCQTVFGEFKEVGSGRSKKIAKRNAALKLLNKLNSSESFKNLKIEKTSADLASITGKEKNTKKSAGNFFTLLKASTNPIILQLLEKKTRLPLHEDSNFNLEKLNLADDDSEMLTKDLFDRLAREENFDYKLFNLGRNKAGLHQVLLQLKVNPILVMNGRGITLEDAVSDASFNGLSLLKLLCNR